MSSANFRHRQFKTPRQYLVLNKNAKAVRLARVTDMGNCAPGIQGSIPSLERLVVGCYFPTHIS